MLPLLLVVLLVGHLALPFADATTTSARSGPDFQVNEILFDGAGSVFTSSGLVLAPDTHTLGLMFQMQAHPPVTLSFLWSTKVLRTQPSRS